MVPEINYLISFSTFLNLLSPINRHFSFILSFLPFFVEKFTANIYNVSKFSAKSPIKAEVLRLYRFLWRPRCINIIFPTTLLILLMSMIYDMNSCNSIIYIHLFIQAHGANIQSEYHALNDNTLHMWSLCPLWLTISFTLTSNACVTWFRS